MSTSFLKLTPSHCQYHGYTCDVVCCITLFSSNFHHLCAVIEIFHVIWFFVLTFNNPKFV
uniref:Uncharacterized protein n=1 Tax=Arundo donax TaxID=35708 RepID=A0A0A9GVR4_ARUDO